MDIGVKSTWKWDDAQRCIKSDPKYRYIRMSMQERKATFAEFLQEDREEERQLSLLKR